MINEDQHWCLLDKTWGGFHIERTEVLVVTFKAIKTWFLYLLWFQGIEPKRIQQTTVSCFRICTSQGSKTFQATPTKQGPGTAFRVFSTIFDQHLCPFYVGVPSGFIHAYSVPLWTSLIFISYYAQLNCWSDHQFINRTKWRKFTDCIFQLGYWPSRQL